MADTISTENRSRNMAAIRSRGNKNTELKFIQIMRKGGITGWRRHQKVPGNPDFIFPRARLAIFVDGCFWHVCPIHGRKPDSNPSYWLPKLQRTIERDKATTRELRRKGWSVLRIWEHELRDETRIIKRCKSSLKRAEKRHMLLR